MIHSKYIHTRTTVSFIYYHFVFCPRYRRKIFLTPGVEERFRELTVRECEERGIKILALECEKDHVYAMLGCLPDQSPADVMKWIKGATSNKLRTEFPVLKAMPSLWTRNFFVSSESSMDNATIEWYVSMQRKSGKNKG